LKRVRLVERLYGSLYLVTAQAKKTCKKKKKYRRRRGKKSRKKKNSEKLLVYRQSLANANNGEDTNRETKCK